MSRRNPFKGSEERWEDIRGGFVKNPSKVRFDDDEQGKSGGGRLKGSGNRPERKPAALPPANKEIEEKKMTGNATSNTAPRPNNPTDNMESCPRCGDKKYRETTFTENGQKKTVKVLVCMACSNKYKQYQEEVKAGNVKFLVANPNAPEPSGPMGKFQWVLSQIDLVKFADEANVAETAYRAKYNEVVVKVLEGRGYLVGAPEWKGNGTSRPVMRFTNAAFTGNGPALRQALEDGLKDLRWAMRKATGRLESATRIKAELEAELAKKAVVATKTLTPAEASEKLAELGDDVTQVATLPPPKKPKKKLQ